MKNANRSRNRILLLLIMILVGTAALRVQASEQSSVVVGTNAEYAPFEYLDEKGNLTGFDYDLLEAVARESNVELVWKDLPFDSLIGAMEAGDIQVIAAGIGPTEDRAKSVDFSDVYYTGSQSIVCQKGAGLQDFDSLQDRSIAVLEGSLSDVIASGENQDYGVVENVTVKRFKNAASAIMELKNGGVDAVLIDTIMADIYCRQTEGIESYVVDGTKEDTVFCIKKGDAELVGLINAGLAKVKESGEYEILYRKYFSNEGESEAVTAEPQERGLLAALHFIFIEDNRWNYYVRGVEITIIISILSVLTGLVLGTVVAFIRLGKKKTWIGKLSFLVTSAYVDIIRGTPSVLQLMIVYFAVFHSNFGYAAAVVCFGINSGAYISEVIRAGILAVDMGQMEAGRAVGLSYWTTMREIILPQAAKNILPAMGNEFIQMIKETSILGYVGILDLTKAASYVSSRTYQMFIPLLAAGIIYYTIVKVLTILMNRLERRLRASD